MTTRARLEEKLERLRAEVKDGRSYEALQMYKTLAFRHKEESQSVYVAGACAMLENGQPTCGAELATLLVKNFNESHTKVSNESIKLILKVADTFPALPAGDHSKVDFLKLVLKWSSTEGTHKSGEPQVVAALAKAYTDIEEFSSAQKYYMKSGDPSGYAVMLMKWSAKGFPGERDLYFARGILQLLAASNLKDANVVYSEILRYVPAAQRTPLLNYIGFLLKTLEHDALPLFELLRKKYAVSIRRDPAFNQLLNQIAEVFYKVKPPTPANQPAGNLPNFFSNLLQGFLQPEASESEPAGAEAVD